MGFNCKKMFLVLCYCLLFFMSGVVCDCDARVLGTGTGPTDHWPLALNAEACKLEHCAREMAACVLDQTCLESVSCPGSCTGESFTAGDWWVTRAWNCASGITFASCHHHSFKKMDGVHINDVSTALSGPTGRVYKRIKQSLSLPYPGVVRVNYDESNGAFPALPDIEDYHIVDKDDSHLLVIFCHGTPNNNLNGAFLLSRSSDYENISEETLIRFKAAIEEHGYNPEDSCIFDNTDCTNGSL